MDWMFESPPNSYVEILLGGKAFSKWLGLDAVSWMGLVPLQLSELLSPLFPVLRGYSENSVACN